MKIGAAHKGGWLRAAYWLALVAFVLRAAVPGGYMLATDGHNRIVVTLCSGHGPTTALFDPRTGQIVESSQKPHADHDKQSEAKPDLPCHFAFAAPVATPPIEAALNAPKPEWIGSGGRPPQTWPQITPTGPPLPARGPPRFA